MKYERIYSGIFKDRPNRFIANIEINGKVEVVHVKNTGRCQELLIEGVEVYVQKSDNPNRKTAWDLIGVKKNDRIINMDSQITNYVVREWIEKGNLIEQCDFIRGEKTYKKSRFDLYVESGERKIYIEVKGVTLEEDGRVKFPDAPSERAIKHIDELIDAKRNGFDAYIFFVIQMKDVNYFTPNRKTQPEFADALLRARKEGVEILAYDCEVTKESIILKENVPVILGEPILYEVRDKLVNWYSENKRDLPWRADINPYKVWVSEIMLQQTRVEAVIDYYNKFIHDLPTIKDLAGVNEDELLKLWEGLGYYNRVRNMQLAAKQIMVNYHGIFPDEYNAILELKGIGTYTAGAISAFAFNKEEPAVDGNVLRVIARLLGDDTDITKASFKKRLERDIKEVIPEGKASEFNQSLIEIGATVCIPNGQPKCERCPLNGECVARLHNLIDILPVKKKARMRKNEKRTILIFKDGVKVAINKRGNSGLLAKLYELPNVEGHLSLQDVIAVAKKMGLIPIRVTECENSKHIFSHIEWDMVAYEIRVDELEQSCKQKYIFEEPNVIEEKYTIPAAFKAYTKYLSIDTGKERMNKNRL